MSLPSTSSVFHASSGEVGRKEGWRGNVVIPSGWVERSEQGLPPSTFTPLRVGFRQQFSSRTGRERILLICDQNRLSHALLSVG
ncbi:hypothetical protein NPIL_134751 [Nephila pilipes]|uniref:Uncharacterized protein n=1 Tax=Nephila pilipes TaxID=299642 RepID=A0A8X6QIB6_NEPPI|nr:hypothetical protein NPIL_134751 [Nephila pilipes]